MELGSWVEGALTPHYSFNNRPHREETDLVDGYCFTTPAAEGSLFLSKPPTAQPMRSQLGQ